DGEVVKAMAVTDKVFGQYLERLTSSGLIGFDSDVERARADRLRGIRAAVNRDKDLVEEAATSLLQSEYVQPALEREVEEFRQQELERARAEIDSALESRRAELASVVAELEGRGRRLKELDEAVRAKQAELEDRV